MQMLHQPIANDIENEKNLSNFSLRSRLYNFLFCVSLTLEMFLLLETKNVLQT